MQVSRIDVSLDPSYFNILVIVPEDFSVVFIKYMRFKSNYLSSFFSIEIFVKYY